MPIAKIPLPLSTSLTLREVAAECRVVRSTVHGWIRHHGLPARKIGGKVLVLRSDLTEWLESQPGWNLNLLGA